jgi:hypothetical protein
MVDGILIECISGKPQAMLERARATLLALVEKIAKQAAP